MTLSRAAAGFLTPFVTRAARLFLLVIVVVGAVGAGVVPVPSLAQTDLGNRVGRVVAENQPAGTLVGSPVTLTGLVGAVTYELGGSDADSFSIDSASGQLRTNGLLDFEEQRRYEVTVTINDDNGSAEVEVWINVTDLEEPGEMSAGPASLRAGTIIRARFTDPDGGVDPSLVIWRWAVSDDGMNFTRVAGGISGETPGKGAEAAAFTPAAEHAGKFLRVRVTYADRRSPNGSNLDKSAEWVSGTRIAPGSTPPALTVRPLLSGLTIPWDVAFTPDGTMLVTERGGRLLSRFPDGRVKEVSADFRDLYSNIYVGLMGLAVDPDFETNRRFYTCQAHTGVRVEVIAWTMADDYSTATRVADPLVGGIGFSQFPRHGGCRVLFGPDGFLWITTGDGDNHTAAQNLNSLNGKVLRVDSQTGQGAPDNPFNSRVYTYGHRNPQGLAFRPGTNQVWTVEHGPSHDDEINLLASGGNYGWDPAGPGYDENVPMTDLKAFPDAVEAKWHSGFPAIATSGAAFLDGSCWGEWNGRLAVAQLKQQELKVFEFTADGTLLSEILVPELDQVYGRLRSPVLGPDCALYVTTSNGSGTDHVLQVYGPSSPRLSGPSTVEYREGDTQPVATFTSHNLDGSVSWTLDGQDASAFRITASGELHFRTPPQFHASTDPNSDNVYHAAVKADNGTSSAQIGVAVSVAHTTTQEPEVSIAAGGGVTEGGDATFTVTADPAPSAALDVTVAITQTGDFGVSPGSHTVTIPTSGTVALTVSTTNDTADEADGSVTATVDPGAGYTVSSTASSAAVAVADDDDPPCDTADAIVRARAAFAWHTDNNGGSETLFWQILAYLGADSMPAPPGGIIPASTTPEAVRTFSDGRTWPGWVPINAAMTCHTPTTPSTAPEVSIAAGAGVGEGGDAVFTVIADPAPTAALDVTVAITQSGDFGVSPGSRMVTVPTTGTATLTVATTNDAADEADGSVTATVGAGSGYTVSATAGTAAVAVRDDDVPEISIAAGADIDEGGSASFTVTADPAPTAALDVTVAVTTSGDFGVSPGSRQVTVPTSGTATLSVATANDSTDEADGSVTANLSTGTGYTISATAGSATVAVSDDDDPAPVGDPCVAALSGDGSVTGQWAAGCGSSARAGRYARFYTFSLDSPSRLTIDLESTADTFMYLRRGAAQKSGAALVSNDDGGDGYNSRISRQLAAGDYTIEATTYRASTARSFTLTVDGIPAQTVVQPDPEISVTAGADVTEGGNAVFTVTADPAPASALDVTVAVTVAGDFGVSPGSRTVTVPTTGTATLTVATTNDAADETDGSVTATLNTGSGYTVSATASTAFVAVADDDPPPAVCVPSLPSDAVTVSEVTGWRNQYSHAEHQQRWNRVLAALGVDTGETAMTVADAQAVKAQHDNTRWDRTVRTLQAMAQCDDPPPAVTPEVSITGGAGITEGGDATFTITADPAPTAPLTVTVSVAQTGDFGVTTGPQSVTVPTTGTATLTVATTNDSADEGAGSVTTTINTGTGYTFSATAGSASVAVADDDNPPPPPATPEVSITAGASITEGGDAIFTVTADPAPTAPLAVSVSVSQSGDFGITGGSRQVTIPSSGTATLTVATTNDSADEADGSVTATVGAGQGYTVSATAGSASVAVADDDDPPPPPVNATPSFSISDASGAEGGTLTFTVTLSPSSNRYAWVHYYARPAFGAAASATFADFAQTYGILTFEPGDTAQTITVALVDDNTPEGNETFKLVLYTPAQAAITDGEATGTITDND